MSYKQGRLKYEEEVNVAMDSLRQAKEEVHSISEKDWREIRSYVKPPAIVELVIGACMVVLGEHATKWNDVLKVIRHKDFVHRVEEFDASGMSAASRRKLKKDYGNNPRFTYEAAMTGSRALGVLHRWVSAQGLLSQLSAGAKDYDLVNKDKKESIDKLAEQLDGLDKDIRKLKQEEQDILQRSNPDGKDLLLDHTGDGNKEMIRGLDDTYTFTDNLKHVLRAAILVNFGPTDTMVKELTPEEVNQLADAFVERAPPLAQEQRAEEERKKLQKELDDARRQAAEAQRQLDEMADELERLREQQPEAKEDDDDEEKPNADEVAEHIADLEDEIEKLKEQLAEAQKAMPEDAPAAAAADGKDMNKKDFSDIIDELARRSAQLKKEAETAKAALTGIDGTIGGNPRLKEVMSVVDED
ncbi:hypothetical protein AGDE_09912 [Angomonas deanei]|nr:hypothetical protein AGDE_09912 [Angomonas deanei]|eukprot:EPY29699.1 hypothetical protein AGDE_09912 [Angomonas deanei]